MTTLSSAATTHPHTSTSGLTSAELDAALAHLAHACGPGPVAVRYHVFEDLVACSEVPRNKCPALFRALDSAGAGCLDREQFIYAISAMHPKTVHREDWMLARTRLIFAAYKSTDGRIGYAEFMELVRDLMQARRENASDDAVAVEAQKLFSCPDAFSEDAFIFTMGVRLSSMLRLPATHRLYRTDKLSPTMQSPVPRTDTHLLDTHPTSSASNFPFGSNRDTERSDSMSSNETVTEPRSNAKWSCHLCTFANVAVNSKCAMCHTPRSVGESAQAQQEQFPPLHVSAAAPTPRDRINYLIQVASI